MLQLFSMLDDEKCGFITVKNLRRAIKELDIDVREE
jgi:Ca2+-binding EF-hand superfamily protein